jgi:hypothetical protein
MVTNIDTPGLIVCTQLRPSHVLQDLARATAWQVLLEADLRSIMKQLESQSREYLLFWIEEEQQIDVNVRLLKLLRHFGQRPRRVVVAYRLTQRAESAFRSQGVHLYLPIYDSPTQELERGIAPLITQAILQLPTVDKAKQSDAIDANLRHRLRASIQLSHPP